MNQKRRRPLYPPQKAFVDIAALSSPVEKSRRDVCSPVPAKREKRSTTPAIRSEERPKAAKCWPIPETGKGCVRKKARIMTMC